MDNRQARMKAALNKHRYGHKGVHANYLEVLNTSKTIKSSIRRKHKVALPVSKPVFPFTKDEYILFTGGVGDVLALESFFSGEKKSKIKGIFYAARSANTLIEIFSSLSCYKQCQHHILWNDFSKFFCFFSKAGVAGSLLNSKKQLPDVWPIVQDWSIGIHFPHLNHTSYHGSSVLQQQLCESKHTFHKPYYVIVPYSPNDARDPNRKMTSAEWNATIGFLNKKDILGVVLNSSAPTSPKHDRIIDLSGQTSILESIEIMKKGTGYIGVDSSLSVLAVKLFDVNNVKIKSNNGHLYDNRRVYYAPHTRFNFVNSVLSF